MFRPLGLYFLGLRDQEHQVDSESQVTMNIMTFMATELKRSPRQACVREQGVGGGEHAGDIQRVWQSVAGPNSDASLTASSA